ncbi:MAG TPA: heavy metal sensor histidine kinase [Chthoniobacterales bacterium]|jgi:two-component system heavy metal sensor histidine kinase CusS|nr:heavy metal sensor histidine kinase [Chthoniobacterales bacterium]
MSLRSTEPRSIASQLVLLFTPAAALLLCCGLGVLYWIVVRHALAEDRAVLADKVVAVRATLRSADGPGLIAQELKALNGGERTSYWVRLLDAAGEVVAETPGMGKLLPLSIFPPGQIMTPAEMPIQDYETDGKLFSLVSIRAAENGRAYVIQVAQDRSVDEQFEREFGLLVAVVLGCGIFASAIIAITVTRRGLRPLNDMTGSLRRVGPNRLHERVPPAEWPRELQPVAIAFDDMLDRLEDSFTRLSQFSADLAHELRTPLANIRGEAEVALTRPRSPNEYAAILESSVMECERLSAVIDNLLFLARAEAAESRVNCVQFEGRAAIERIAAYNEAIAEERHLQIICAGEGEVYADPVLFGRAVSNLVDNAVRFTPDGGRIEISLRSTQEHAEIAVEDTGCGIAAEHISRVLDRFYRVDASRSSEGTGLGLALVKSIADLHGGTVAVSSEEGRGTRVTLRFPNQREPEE